MTLTDIVNKAQKVRLTLHGLMLLWLKRGAHLCSQTSDEMLGGLFHAAQVLHRQVIKIHTGKSKAHTSTHCLKEPMETVERTYRIGQAKQ